MARLPLSTADFIEKTLFTHKMGKLFLFCSIILSTSIVVTGIVYSHVMLAGHSTLFPPSERRLGFQKGPTSRGTLTLIWACFSTIFTCIYVSLHLDVPFQLIDQDTGEKVTQNTNWDWLKIWRWLKKQTLFQKVVWMSVNLVIPEILTGVATWEYRSAKAGVEYMESKGYKGWTLTHAFFADMGGFKVPDDCIPGGRVLHSGVEFYDWFETVHPEGTIDFYHLLLEINDRSKADFLLKTITCIHALWLVVQTVVRAIEHRPVSELELTTCAYVLCTVVTYSYWWHKPKDVRRHILLHVDRPPRSYVTRTPTPLDPLRHWMKSSFDTVMRVLRSNVINPLWNWMKFGSHTVVCAFRLNVLWNWIEAGFKTVVRFFRSNAAQHRVPPLGLKPKQAIDASDSWPYNRYCGIEDVQWTFCIAGVIGAGVGAIHCGLWNAQFVNSNGQLLWRICCGIQIAALLIEALKPQLPGVSKTFHAATFIITGSAFCFARIVTVLLIILSFRSLPAGVYADIDWTWSAFPH